MADFENISGLCSFVLDAFLLHHFKIWHLSKITLIFMISFGIYLSIYHND